MIPGESARWLSGGLRTSQRLAPIIGAELVTTHEPSPSRRQLGEVLAAAAAEDVFVATWGPHVPDLIERTDGRRSLYWANSLGWGFQIPPRVPVLCASRFTMGHWAEDAPASPIYYLPNPVEEVFTDRGTERDIDVLVMRRKTSGYVLDVLVPMLRSEGLSVHVQDGHVDDLAGLFNRAWMFIYDSREQWVRAGVSEGFGLPPLEALACGCRVATSMNAGLADFTDPPLLTHQLGVYGPANDVTTISRALEAAPPDPAAVAALVAAHRGPAIAQRWAAILDDLEHFWPATASPPTLSNPRAPRVYQRSTPAVGSWGRRWLGGRVRRLRNRVRRGR